MPSLSPTMTHGTIAKWLVKPGDQLQAGDVVCEIETDKAAVAFEMQDASVLAKILVEAQSAEIAVGQTIAFTVEDKEAYEAFLKVDPKDYPVTITSPSPSSSSDSSAPSVSTSTPVSATSSAPAAPVSTKDVLLSPAARNLIQRDSIDVSNIKGSGKRGMISKSDVITALKTGGVSKVAAAAPSVSTPQHSTPRASAATSIPAQPLQSADSPYVDIPNSNMRKIIAKRLTESKATVPHFYVSIECNLDDALALRSTLKKDYQVNISVNDLVIKASALALRDMPEVNAKFNPSTKAVAFSSGVDISVAVATPNGLITPIVTNADKRSLVDINNTVKELAGRARAGKLKPEEFQGGSFSISNLGMYGIDYFSAVINPPQACILAVGSGVKKVLPPKAGSSRPYVGTTVTVQLSADRRVVDEAMAGQFMQLLSTYLGSPNALLL